MTELRKGLPPLPEKMRKLKIDHRGYCIPWFVSYIDGKPDFRLADARKRVRAVNEKLCWLCGERLGRYQAFVIGPMCAVNRNTSEPPSHLECAEFAVKACPFMILPTAKYREAHLPEGSKLQPGSIPGNPGATCIWTCEKYQPYRVDVDSWLIRIGPPTSVTWWCEGRLATRDEILESFERRLPELQKIAQSESPAAEAALADMVQRTMMLLPT